MCMRGGGGGGLKPIDIIQYIYCLGGGWEGGGGGGEKLAIFGGRHKSMVPYSVFRLILLLVLISIIYFILYICSLIL